MPKTKKAKKGLYANIHAKRKRKAQMLAKQYKAKGGGYRG